MNIKLSSLNKGLVGHWTMSQDSLKGSLLGDKTPYSNDGTIYGATFTTDRMGQPNKAMSFDGSYNNYVQVSAIPSLKTGTSFVLSAWVYPEHTGDYRTIMGYDGRHRLLICFDGTMLSQQNGNFHSQTGAVPNQKWTHVVYWCNGSEERWYINGVLSGVPRSIIDAEWDQAFKIGQYDLANYAYKGKIDDVRIYNRALSEPEIKTLYNSYNPNIKMKTSLPKIKFSKALKGTFVDSRDGTEYKTIKIGNQTWMAENLKYLPAVHSNVEFANQTTSARYGVYGYDGSVVATAKAHTNYSAYGVLYNYAAALTACPTGWHLPTDEEFKTLEKYLGMTQEQADATGWRGTNEGSKLSTFTSGGNNSSGFTALMSGYRYSAGGFSSVGSLTYFWASSEGGAGAWNRSLDASYSAVGRKTSFKAAGFSVRCIRDY